MEAILTQILTTEQYQETDNTQKVEAADDTLNKIDTFLEHYAQNTTRPHNTSEYVPIKEACLKFASNYPQKLTFSSNAIKTHIIKNYTKKLDIKKIRNRYVCQKKLLDLIEFNYNINRPYFTKKIFEKMP